MIKNEQDIVDMIASDEWMMRILHTVKALHLPNWWICAGFIRARIWDELSGFQSRTNTPDIDVIYFDKINMDETEEKRLEAVLMELHEGIPWSVKNEARMHLANGVAPYQSSADAISKFPETATAIGVKLDASDQIVLLAPHGLHDVIHMLVRPTPFFMKNPQLMNSYSKRTAAKKWQLTWPGITFVKH